MCKAAEKGFALNEGIMAKGIIVLGATFVDIKGYPTDVFIPTGRNMGKTEQVHGGVSRNIAEDIGNLELRPTFVSFVDETGMGEDVVRKLKNHKVNTDYIFKVPDGMGTWLAIFDNNGDVAASISKRPDLSALSDYLNKYGDEIFSDCDSIAIEFDMDKEATKTVYKFAKKYNKPVYSAVSNMRIAVERRDLMKQSACSVCNISEAGILFSEDYSQKTPEEMVEILAQKVEQAQMSAMIVTMGEQGAVYVSANGEKGVCPANKVDVIDTTGAGDAFFAGITVGLTYGKNMAESCAIGTRLASSVIQSKENVCPRFLPSEFDLNVVVD